jgi:hypothetical protein
MRQSTVALAAFTAAILAAGTSAQEKPSFSGAWTTVVDTSTGPKVSLGSGWGDRFTLLQDSSTLTVERVFYLPRDYQPLLKLRFSLDGSETRDTLLMGRGIQVLVSTAAWEGDKLLITTVHTVRDMPEGQTATCDVTRTLSLQPPQMPAWSPSLVVETRRCGFLGGPPSTTRTVYTRN